MKFLFDTDTLSVWQWDTMPDAGVLRLRLDELADGKVLPGFVLELADLFAASKRPPKK